jgi:broad specificity phosphatase PhoE
VTTRLFLVRHAESEWNVQRRWQGQSDVALSDRGRADAAAAAEALALLEPFDLIVTSPLSRAFETARIFAARLGLEPINEILPGLQEIDVGEWTGKTIAEVEGGWPNELRAWREGSLDAPPGGESRDALVQRALSAIESETACFEDSTMLVVTHGGVIGRLERHIGVHPGRGSSNLEGRWFSYDLERGELRALSDRITFTPADRGPAPEAR